MRVLSISVIATSKVTNIYKTQKILQPKEIEVAKFMYKYNKSQPPAACLFQANHRCSSVV